MLVTPALPVTCPAPAASEHREYNVNLHHLSSTDNPGNAGKRFRLGEWFRELERLNPVPPPTPPNKPAPRREPYLPLTVYGEVPSVN